MIDVQLEIRTADQNLAGGRWDDAYRGFLRAYNTGLDDSNIHAGLGIAAYKRGRLQEAYRHLADACLRRDVPHWRLFLADCCIKLGLHYPAWRLVNSGLVRAAVAGADTLRQQALALLQRHLRDIGEVTDQRPPDSRPAARDASDKVGRLLKQNRNHEAHATGAALLRRFPACTALLVNYGLACKRCGDYDAAQRAYAQALLINPDEQGLCANLGNLLLERGNIFLALRLLEMAAIAMPADAMVFANLGAAYLNAGNMPVEAEFAGRKALELGCTAKANCFQTIASALTRQGRHDEGLKFYEMAAADDGDSRLASLLALQYGESHSADEIAKAHSEFAASMVIEQPRQFSRGFRRGPTDIKVGFVSADLREHSVAYFAEPLIEQLGRMGVSVYAYHNHGTEDGVSARIRSHCRAWRNVKPTSDDDLAALICGDDIDVLVDLSGHTAGSRLPVFARRAAPLQLTWLGHPNTSGLPTMDLRITDRLADPVGVDHRYAEKLARLDGVFCAYRPCIRNPLQSSQPEYAVGPSPVVRNGHVTFGSCNTLAKYTPTTIAMWAAVLRAVPGSKMLIEAPGLHSAALQRTLTSRFFAHGIGEDRLILRSRDTSLQYKIYNLIDISLDTYPCNGGTTTCDLLWMGVPVVTRYGDGFAGRMGLSLVSSLGEPDWAVASEAAFVERAAALAESAESLRVARSEQRERMETSAIMDEAGFAQRFMQAIMREWNSN